MTAPADALAAAIEESWGELLAPLGGQPDGLQRSAAAILAALEAAGFRIVPIEPSDDD